MEDVFGQALHDHYEGIQKQKLWIYNRYGPKEEMPLDVYFRNEEEMPDMELLALKNCYGKVLDIGAGAGSHTLILQRLGLEVTAMDISGLAIQIMKARGVINPIEADIFQFNTGKYDTLLLMMNGIGLAGTIQQFRLFLKHADKLLSKGGQLLFDSSNVAYLYDDVPYGDTYYGEIDYQYAYKGYKTDWFKWLYIDMELLSSVAADEGWTVEILFEDDMDQYLCKLTRAI
ncbi:class I SAM-dependent methyltransferase [Mucilaginibacter glaciei]|uniref:Methyltransferase domain-containing protein n=1 Tax=Mucilaginibacter glaciei TaxID=2772109 RepID=A0A926NR14_9SPHI|nr:methyltransferase domain-containing protein [Mucilaginibacter glaciei]MBD1392295.1 methyltransferase domain-containing protein [Mucilaginibacter glaciei]